MAAGGDQPEAPLISGVVSIVLLAGGAALLAAGEGDKMLTTVFSIVGALGLTSAGLYGRAKAQITSLFANLSQAVRIARIPKQPTCVRRRLS